MEGRGLLFFAQQAALRAGLDVSSEAAFDASVASLSPQMVAAYAKAVTALIVSWSSQPLLSLNVNTTPSATPPSADLTPLGNESAVRRSPHHSRGPPLSWAGGGSSGGESAVTAGGGRRSSGKAAAAATQRDATSPFTPPTLLPAAVGGSGAAAGHHHGRHSAADAPNWPTPPSSGSPLAAANVALHSQPTAIFRGTLRTDPDAPRSKGSSSSSDGAGAAAGAVVLLKSPRRGGGGSEGGIAAAGAGSTSSLEGSPHAHLMPHPPIGAQQQPQRFSVAGLPTTPRFALLRGVSVGSGGGDAAATAAAGAGGGQSHHQPPSSLELPQGSLTPTLFALVSLPAGGGGEPAPPLPPTSTAAYFRHRLSLQGGGSFSPSAAAGGRPLFQLPSSTAAAAGAPAGGARRRSTLVSLVGPLQPGSGSGAGGVRIHSKLNQTIDDAGFDMINDYLILSPLGSGTQGTVALALDTRTGAYCAVKALPRHRMIGRRPSVLEGAPLNAVDEEAATLLYGKQPKALHHEVAIMKKLRHHNIVRLLGVIDDPEANLIFIAMEYIDGGPIGAERDDGVVTDPVPPAKLIDYLGQICDGLSYLHACGIVHRDIKPSNILVTQEGVVKLADFGTSEMTETDALIGRAGTPMFMAPELWTGATEVRGAATDLWSLGVTLFVLLLGRLPFVAPDRSTLVQRVLESPPDLGAPVAGSVCGPEWRALLSGLLEKDPSRRWCLKDVRAWVQQQQQQQKVLPEERCPSPTPGQGKGGKDPDTAAVATVVVTEEEAAAAVIPRRLSTTAVAAGGNVFVVSRAASGSGGGGASGGAPAAVGGGGSSFVGGSSNYRAWDDDTSSGGGGGGGGGNVVPTTEQFLAEAWAIVNQVSTATAQSPAAPP